MKTYLSDLFDYNENVNQILLNFFKENSYTNEKAVYLFSHMLNAHHIWISRIDKHRRLPSSQLYGVFQVHEPGDLSSINADNCRRTFKLLDESDGVSLEQIINYTNSAGIAYENKLRDILLHLVNHSTYHRAQIATLIRQDGLQPPATDYFLYTRKAIL